MVFRDTELPAPEERLRPLIITVGANDYPLPGVLVDIGASRSVCSLTTLDYLDVGKEQISKHRFTYAAYDNSQWEAYGTIQLEITVGPLTSTTTVIVMEQDLSEPLILGRSWLAKIHVVASLMHQLIKFKYQGEVITV